MYHIAINKLRVNIKSLNAEMVFNRNEAKRMLQHKHGKDYVGYLESHLDIKVKPEVRLAYLALGYVKDKPYRTVENTTRHPVNANKLYDKIKRFKFVRLEDVVDWLGR